jgi:preprotein translocase subunit SecE
MARSADLGGPPPRPLPESRPAGEVQAGRGPGGPFRFIGESWAELRKVEWPTQNQVFQGTVVVLIACVIVGLFLYVNDEVWKRVVSKIFLGE